MQVSALACALICKLEEPTSIYLKIDI